MKVAIDMQLAVGTATGIGEYVRSLAGALPAAGVEVVKLFDPSLDPWRFDRRVYWDQVLLPQKARSSGADLLHCASGTVPLSQSLPTIVTVHDVAWLRVQAHTRIYARYYFGRFSLDRYKSAATLVVDSDYSRRELVNVVPSLASKDIHVVYPGVADDYCTIERGQSDGSTILVVGTVEKRKNLRAIIEALPHLPGARMVSVGPFTPYREECIVLAHELGVPERVEFLGYVEREKLLHMYTTCAVVAMPSRYEGFGYAAAQGLCAGVPVVVSDQSSLPEVSDGDAVIVPVDDRSAWVDALREALSGRRDAHAVAVRDHARNRFSNRKTASDMAAAYRSALSP